MGPLVGNLIDANFDYLLALVIGIGFGYVLEQAGFSSTRKLAGVFYGYDFVVLRVFFTAALTAIIGVAVLNRMGMLDLSAIYVNPTFLWPAIVGGLIMGLGFIMGGFCPGTSISAVAIGKLDAMVFVGGLFVGAFIFAEAYPLYEDFYTSSYLGDLLVYQSLDMPRGLFVFMLICIALVAFVVTYIIEQKVNETPVKFSVELAKKHPIHTAAIAGTFIIGFVLLFVTDYKTALYRDAETVNLSEQNIVYMDPRELAFRLIDRDDNIQIIDVRTDKEFGENGLPQSVNVQYEDLMNNMWVPLFDNPSKKKIIIADTEIREIQALQILEALGYDNFVILKGGFSTFQSGILSATDKTVQDLAPTDKEFVKKAGPELMRMIENNKKKGFTPPPAKKVKGGC